MLIVLAVILGGIIWKWGNSMKNLRLKSFVRDVRLFVSGTLSVFSLTLAKHQNLTIDKIFEETAKKYPNKICFRFENEKWTFREVQEAANRISNYFLQEGFVKGDHIGLMMENRVEYICIWLGLARIGVVTALINHNLRLTPLQHCFKAGFCKGVIYDGSLEGAIEELKDQGMLESNFKLYSFGASPSSPSGNKLKAAQLESALADSSPRSPPVTSQVNFDDELFYIYTSGTTGLPKAAIIKNSRFLFATIFFHYVAGIFTSDVIYTPLPLYHISGCIAVGQALQFGSTVAVTKKLSASRFWQECIHHNATVIQYIGEVCRYLLVQPVRPEEKEHNVRLIFGNGLRPEIWTEFVSRFKLPNVSEFYGSTEGNCNMINFDNTVGAVGSRSRMTSMFLRNYLVRLDEATGEILRDPTTGLAQLCDVDEPGELVGMIGTKSAHTEFKGYTDPEAHRKKIVTDVLKKGDKAFRSGDLLVMDKFGYFYFKDRQGDTFRWKGENVSTAEVENVVSKASGLRDATVYGVSVPGSDGKAGMAAIVDPDRSLDLIALAGKLSTELPSYARPLFIRILNQIEMTGTFKFKKGDLQKEGFDISKVTDPLYFFMNGKYVPLDSEAYNLIISGKTLNQST